MNNKESKKFLDGLFLNGLFYYKQTYLMAESYFGDSINNITALYTTIVKNTKTIEQLTDTINTIAANIERTIPKTILNELNDVDYTEYTRKNYGNVFWNEIPNDSLTELALEQFITLGGTIGRIDTAENEPDAYMISLYDFNNYEIIFKNEIYLNTFIAKYAPDCASVFSKRGDSWVEEYDI